MARRTRRAPSGARLTADPATGALFRERARRLAVRGLEPAIAYEQQDALICMIGEAVYALPLEAVARVAPYVRRGAVVGRPPLIGLVAEAGRMLQVLDLPSLVGVLGRSAADPPQGYLCILRPPHAFALRTPERPVAATIEHVAGLDPGRVRISQGSALAPGRTAVQLSLDELLVSSDPAIRSLTA